MIQKKGVSDIFKTLAFVILALITVVVVLYLSGNLGNYMVGGANNLYGGLPG